MKVTRDTNAIGPYVQMFDGRYSIWQYRSHRSGLDTPVVARFRGAHGDNVFQLSLNWELI